MTFNFIIYNPKTKLFDFFIKSLIVELNNRNINTITIIDNDIPLNLIDKNINNNVDVILIIINPHFIFDYKNIYDDIDNISKLFKYKILYLTEPINFIVEKNVYLELVKFIKPYCLWTYTIENFHKIKTYLNHYKIFPNYNDGYNFTEIDINNIKNKNKNNIIFIGNINENRINVCNQFNELLINKTNSWTLDEWKELLNNNLFYLNIHRRNNCKSFESFRIIPLLANGCIIFSENSNIDEEKIYEGYNIIFCKKDNLYDTFIKYKENINYENIFEKALLFRKNMLENIDLDKYINFHREKCVV
jgi:hypothetical protein